MVLSNLVPAAIFVPLKGTLTGRLHTKPHKFGYNVFPNILHMNYRTDLVLGQAFCIFLFFYFPWVKRFSEYLTYELSHRPGSRPGFLYISLLLFPRFWTFCIDRLEFLFLMALKIRPQFVQRLFTFFKRYPGELIVVTFYPVLPDIRFAVDNK